jgi:hypothetical protein
MQIANNRNQKTSKAQAVSVLDAAAEQVTEKIKTPSFRGTFRAEESLFSWI